MSLFVYQNFQQRDKKEIGFHLCQSNVNIAKFLNLVISPAMGVLMGQQYASPVIFLLISLVLSSFNL